MEIFLDFFWITVILTKWMGWCRSCWGCWDYWGCWGCWGCWSCWSWGWILRLVRLHIITPQATIASGQVWEDPAEAANYQTWIKNVYYRSTFFNVQTWIKLLPKYQIFIIYIQLYNYRTPNLKKRIIITPHKEKKGFTRNRRLIGM